jgi:hypothetical protein
MAQEGPIARGERDGGFEGAPRAGEVHCATGGETRLVALDQVLELLWARPGPPEQLEHAFRFALAGDGDAADLREEEFGAGRVARLLACKNAVPMRLFAVSRRAARFTVLPTTV